MLYGIIVILFQVQVLDILVITSLSKTKYGMAFKFYYYNLKITITDKENKICVHEIQSRILSQKQNPKITFSSL